LPEDFRKLTGEIVIQIAEFPTDEIMDDLSLETPLTCSACSRAAASPSAGTRRPAKARTASRSIAAPCSTTARNEETFGDIVTHVLIHEIGHHFSGCRR